MHHLKHSLGTTFTSEKWTTCSYAKELLGKRVQDIILTVTFWNGVVYVLKLMGPLVKVLRLVDNQKIAAMGYIYEAMDCAKEAIQKNLMEKKASTRMYLRLLIKDGRISFTKPFMRLATC